MKILQISSNWGHGGPGGIVKDLYYQITNHGDKCLVAYGRGTIPSDIPSTRIGNLFYSCLHAFFSRLFDCAGFCSKKATKKLIDKIIDYEPDIIQIHNLLGYYINIEILFSFLKEYGKPIVWTIHDCWPITGHCINFERINCNKWLKGCNKCKLKKDYPQAYFFDRSKRNWVLKHKIFSDVPQMEIICPSLWMKSNIIKTFFSNYPIHVINNGIDLKTFKPTKPVFKKQFNLCNKIVLLAVAGVWNEMKGENLLYEIAQKLDERYVVVMVGKKSHKCPNNIIDIDRTNSVEELVKWYSSSDLFINPTFGDNFPTVNLEALACGLPVVANATGGCTEVINETVGRIVVTKTSDEFVQKINDCINANISKNVCVLEAKKYDKERCFSKYVSIYERLLK